MRRIKIWNDSPSESQVREAADVIEKGGILIIPTDTMYALACDALNSKAIDRLCKAKGINPEKQPLSIICSDISMASEYARIQDDTFTLMRGNLPGPFTFLLKATSSLPKAFKGRKTVGIRVPDNNFTRRLADYLGHPLLSTSIPYANDSDYAINPDLIAEYNETRADLMVEAEEGSTEVSAIIDCTGEEPVVVREGIRQLH
ncbi:MAG: threonylcarbamoyl-AMP synthase [Muribaculaceae bacterium]|nr:threonylcarbamoyl-AMP synthase [Muribaculaceae bacterium]